MLPRDPIVGRPVGLLDIGTSKVCCLIVAAGDPGGSAPMRVLGLGHKRSRGLKAAMIVDLDQAEDAVREAVGDAERAAGVTLESVHTAVESGRIRSHHFTAHADLGGLVGPGDVDRLLEGARSYVERDGRVSLHLGVLGYRLDGAGGIIEPIGLAGRRLSADVHSVTADGTPLRTMLQLLERCYLDVGAVVPAGLASGLAAATSEERQIGVTVFDLGAGTTTIATFRDNRLFFTETVPVGGLHITYDIARVLSTPLAEAERIKTLYGTVVSARSDENEVVTYRLAGADDGAMGQTSRAALRAIITPRVASVVELVRERLSNARVPVLGASIVLTGGGSELVGIAERFALAFGLPARVARPPVMMGLPSSVVGPAFSTVAGLAAAAQRPEGRSDRRREVQKSPAGYIGRLEHWLRESF